MSYNERSEWSVKKIVLTVLTSILGIIIICGIFGSFSLVGTGERGVKSRLGKVYPESHGEGVVMKWPFFESVKKMNVQTKKTSVETSTYTKDVQSAKIVYAVNYNVIPEMVHKLYQSVGKDYANVILIPAVENTLKDVIGRWNAQDLVGSRDKAKNMILVALQKAAKEDCINVSDFQILDINFSDAFEKSIENKVIEEQNALAAINKTRRITEEANQTIAKANADAQSMEIRAKALEKNPKLTEYEAVQRWDGKLPQYMMGNTIPFMNIGK